MLGEILSGMGASFLYDILRDSYKKLRMRNLLSKLFEDGDITILVPSIQLREFFIPTVMKTSSIPKNVPLLPFPETIAISVLYDTLTKLFPTKKIKLEPASNAVNITTHIVSIGGPSVNTITEELLNGQRVSRCLSIVYPNHYVVDELRKCEYHSIENSGSITDDYGFIIISQNPYAPNSLALILMGVWAHGTNSAVQTFLTLGESGLRTKGGEEVTKEYVNKIIRKVKNGEVQCISIISHSNVFGLLTGQPKIVDIRTEP